MKPVHALVLAAVLVSSSAAQAEGRWDPTRSTLSCGYGHHYEGGITFGPAGEHREFDFAALEKTLIERHIIQRNAIAKLKELVKASGGKRTPRINQLIDLAAGQHVDEKAPVEEIIPRLYPQGVFEDVVLKGDDENMEYSVKVWSHTMELPDAMVLSDEKEGLMVEHSITVTLKNKVTGAVATTNEELYSGNHHFLKKPGGFFPPLRISATPEQHPEFHPDKELKEIELQCSYNPAQRTEEEQLADLLQLKESVDRDIAATQEMMAQRKPSADADQKEGEVRAAEAGAPAQKAAESAEAGR